MNAMGKVPPAPESVQNAGPWSPFRERAFAFLWIATVLSNIGTWMHDVGAGWLMTELSPSPAVVALVQAATTAPVFLFALLAGAVADIVDRRKLLIAVNSVMALTAAGLAFVVWMGAMTPALLVVFTFLLGTGAAFVAPAWQAIVPSLVDRPRLPAAIALNSMGINVSRAIGPALAGFLIVALGLVSPFALNALSFLGIIAVLIWWKPKARPASNLPPERIGQAIRAGVRYVTHSKALKGALVRAAAFFAFASCYWALLPLIAREVLSGGPTLYGLLLAAIGVGAVGGAVLLPKVRKALGADKTVIMGTVGTAATLIGFAYVPDARVAVALSALAGFSWIAVLSSLHVAAQTSLPDWVRARGLSIFLTVFFGSMAGGSLLWGNLAAAQGIPLALTVAAVGALICLPLAKVFRLDGGGQQDHAPSSHWPEPILADGLAAEDDRGPVRIRIVYRVEEVNAQAFRSAISQLREARLRNGGYGWSLYQDTSEPERFEESWEEASWLQHLRHHERVSEAEKALQDAVNALIKPDTKTEVSHLLGS